MADRMMVSVHRGLAPISFPAEWLNEIDMDAAFASRGREGLIRFNSDRAYAIRVEGDGPDEVRPIVRRLSEDEISSVNWGGFCSPFESYGATMLFGHGSVTALDTVTELD